MAKYIPDNEKIKKKLTILDVKGGYPSQSLQNLTECQLTKLPSEILEIIASFLEVKCVLNMGQTCQLLQAEVVNNNRMWRNLYERDFVDSAYEVNYDLNVNVNWKTKYKDALHSNCVFILNNVDCCTNDVNEFKTKFLKLGYRIILYCNKKFCPRTLEIAIRKQRICPTASLIICFFGCGNSQRIYIGDDYISYDILCELFFYGRRGNNSKVIFFSNTQHLPSKENQCTFANSLFLICVDSFFHLFYNESLSIDELLEQRKWSNDEIAKCKTQVMSNMKQVHKCFIKEQRPLPKFCSIQVHIKGFLILSVGPCVSPVINNRIWLNLYEDFTYCMYTFNYDF